MPRTPETANGTALPYETVPANPYAEEAVMAENSEDYATANLAALNRAKALAEKWETAVKRLDALAALKTDAAERAEVSTRAQALQECAHQLREALRPEGAR